MRSVSSTLVLDLPCTVTRRRWHSHTHSHNTHTTTSRVTSKATSHVESCVCAEVIHVMPYMRGTPRMHDCKSQAQGVFTQLLSKGLFTTLDQECPTAGHDQTNSEGQSSLYMRLAVGTAWRRQCTCQRSSAILSVTGWGAICIRLVRGS